MAKRAAARSSVPAPSKKAESLDGLTTTEQPSHEAIAQRAFELYLSRGAGEGSEVSDWLRAESELKNPRS